METSTPGTERRRASSGFVHKGTVLSDEAVRRSEAGAAVLHEVGTVAEMVGLVTVQSQSRFLHRLPRLAAFALE